MANAQNLGLTVAPLDALPVLPDIDTLADLQAWHDPQTQQQQQIGLASIAAQILEQAAKSRLSSAALNAG